MFNSPCSPSRPVSLKGNRRSLAAYWSGRLLFSLLVLSATHASAQNLQYTKNKVDLGLRSATERTTPMALALGARARFYAFTLRSLGTWLLFLCAMILFPFAALAQNPAPNVAYTSKAVDLGLRGNLTVNPSTQALEIQIPFGNYAGRAGLNVPIAISYSSKVHRLKYEGFNPGHFTQEGLPLGDGYTMISARFSENSSAGWTTSVGFPVRDFSAQGEKYDMFGNAVGTDGQCFIQHENGGRAFYPCLTIDRVIFRMPDGSTHELRSTDQPRFPNDPVLDNYYSVDGARMRYQSSTQTLFMADGSRYILSANPKYIDRNGNTITPSTDTLGRPISSPPLSSTTGDFPYSLPGVGASAINYTFKWRYLDDPGVLTTPQQLRYIASSRCPLGTGSYSPFMFVGDSTTRTCIANGDALFRPVVLYQVLLPTGQAYTFTYNIYGEIEKVVLPTGGYERYEYAQIAPLSNMVQPYTQANRGITRRFVSASGLPADEVQWQYSGGGGSVTITAPDGSLSGLSMYTDTSLLGTFGYSLNQARAGRTFAEGYYSPPDASGARQLLRRHLSEWSVTGSNATGQFSNAQQYATRNARVTKEVDIIFDTGGPALAKTTTHKYDLTYQFSTGVNETAINEYDFVTLDQTTAQSIQIGSVPTGSLLRRIEKTYLDAGNQAYRDLNILGLVTSLTVYKGSAGDANVVSRTNISYDETSLPLYTPPTTWIDPGSYRGNATTTSRWLNVNGGTLSTFPQGTYIVAHAQYDQFGNVRTTTDANGNQSLIDYSITYSYAYPTTVTSAVPDPSGQYGSTSPFATTTNYDFNTGLVLSTMDANGKATSYDYTDPLNRQRQVTQPNGARVSYLYSDTPNDLYVGVLADEDASRVIETRKYFDGLGRAVRGFLYDGTPSMPWLVTDTYYDKMGRALQVSNPYRVSSPSSSVPATCSLCTTNTYDALGRVTAVTTPDSAHVTTAYAASTNGTFGMTVTVTDQAGKVRRSATDALGRLLRVDEPDQNNNLDVNGVPFQSTSYSYDALDNLTTVTQGTQTRTFVYDSLKRLTWATNPESGTISYLYDNNGNLTQKTDARLVVATYAYDALNRNLNVIYTNDPAGTPTVTRTYDGATNGKGKLWKTETGGSAASRTTINNYDFLGRPGSQSQQFYASGAWGQPFTVGATYDKAGHVLTLTYPSGHTSSYSYDSAGRTSSFSGNLGEGVTRTYANEFQYTESGAIQQEKFGTDTPLYHKQRYNERGQLWDMRLSTVAYNVDPANGDRGAIVNYYSNNFAPGGTGADNNGNLLRQEIYIPGSSFFQQDFAYDSLNRLTSVAEKLNGTGGDTFKQAYTYDRWGNRTIDQGNTWGPATGPAINKKDFTVNPANNRLGVPAGQTGTMSYDNAGNLTADTYSGAAVTRVYDAENRMASEAQANSYLAGSYTYNADGQRVRRTVGGQPSAVTTWQVYGMGGELLAEYAANAASNSPQKEYGYRNGQLLVTAEPQAAARANVARATNGGIVSYSSQMSPYVGSFANDGEHLGYVAGQYTFWRDNTNNTFPDWLEIDFNGSKAIDEIDIYTVQDNAETPAEPTTSTTFSLHGITDFDVQYWNGSAWTTVPGGSVTGNNKVWKKLTFTAVTTSKIRVTVNSALNSASRIVELEAWGTAAATVPVNVAAASQGATATAQNYTQDSVYPGYHWQPPFAIDGQRYSHLIANGSDGTGFWRDEHGLSSWLEVDFSGAQTIDEVDVFTVADYPALLTQADPLATQTFTQFGTTAFEVQYWTGSAWVAVPNGSITGNNLVWRKINFAAITTSKIRVVISAAADGVARLAEVEAWTAASTVANLNWLVTDHLGTPRLVFDKTGSLANVKRHDYLPFGEELSAGTGGRTATQGYTGDSVRQKFTSKERDSETGLDYFLARYYSNPQGRFTSVDPEQEGARSDDPQSWNGYAYARNSPLVYSDPNGRNYTVCDANGKECVTYTDKEFDKFMKGGPADGYTFNNGNIYYNGELTATYSNDCLYCGALINEMAARGPAVKKLTGAFVITTVVIGTAGGAGAYVLGTEATVTTLGIASRGAPAAGAAAGVLNQLSRTDASIFQKMAELGGSAQNSFLDNVYKLTDAVFQVVGPAGKVEPIGRIGNSLVYGGRVSGVGIAEVNGVTVVVKMAHGNPQILGPLP